MRLITTALTALILATSSYAAEDVTEILRRVNERYDSMRSLSVTFENSFTFEQAGITDQKSEGRFVMKKPYLFRMEMEQVVQGTDGELFWSYSPISRQVQLYDYDPAKAAIRPDNFLTAFITEEGAVYIGQERVDGRRCHVIEIRPQDSSAEIEIIRVWVDRRDWIARKVRYTNRNGSLNIFSFTNVTVNPDLPPNTFSYTPDSTVEVIDFRRTN